MLYAFLKKGCFQDSVSLMLISRDLSKADDVKRVSVMMGTPANKEVFRETGMWHETLEEAGPNDVCVVVESDQTQEITSKVAKRLEEALAQLAKGRQSADYPVVHSLSQALRIAPDSNLALISVAGAYAHEPARQALEKGLNVMLFSDNVPVDEELELKRYGHEHGLLVMGPDCGTSVISGAPLAFANRMPAGAIGIVGASGTGIQEVCSQIVLAGSGITHAIGLGGRDLSADVGGISAQDALKMLADDAATRVIVFISKPPAASVAERITALMLNLDKPVVALFLGTRPKSKQAGSVRFAESLDEAARLAVELEKTEKLVDALPHREGGHILGLYTGGTLAAEAACLAAELLKLKPAENHNRGVMLCDRDHLIIDLGDDAYTRGRPHPMIDPSVRTDALLEIADKMPVEILLADVVLGFGSHPDPAGAFAQAFEEVKRRQGNGKAPVCIATVTGTEEDVQVRSRQIEKLRQAGIVVADNTRQAVTAAARIVRSRKNAAAHLPESSLLKDKPKVVNIGLRSFAQNLQDCNVSCVQYEWVPACQGNERLQKLLSRMK